MGENINFVVAFPAATLANVNLEQATNELAIRLLGERPMTWIAIRAMSHSEHLWPPESGEIHRRLLVNEVIAVYPRQPASTASGAVVWSKGLEAGTAVVSVPIELAPKDSREAMAVAALETCRRSATLCAVGSELELPGDTKDDLSAIEVARRPEVELVSFFGAAGRVEVTRSRRGGQT